MQPKSEFEGREERKDRWSRRVVFRPTDGVTAPSPREVVTIRFGALVHVGMFSDFTPNVKSWLTSDAVASCWSGIKEPRCA